MSDVPLGAMLSGGLDSSLIVALMARHMTEPLETFAVGFAGENSELPRRPARGRRARRRPPRARGRAQHRARGPQPPDLAPRRAARATSRRSASSRSAELAVRARHRRALRPGRRRALRRLPQAPRRLGRRALGQGARPPSAARAAAGDAPRPRPRRPPRRRAAGRRPVARLLASSSLVQPELRGALYGGALAEHAGAAENVLRGRLAGTPRSAPLEAALYLDARLGLVDDMLTYFDRASMACSLEVRVPFLDHEFVELARDDPDPAQGARACTGKHVLRLAAKGLRPGLRAGQEEARLLQRGGRHLGRRRRRRARRPPAARPPIPPTPRSSTGRRSPRRAPSGAPARRTTTCCWRS